MHMVVIRKRPDKKEPDTITTLERIAKVGVHPLEKTYVLKIPLPLCPYVDTDICPLAYKYGIKAKRKIPLEELRIIVEKEEIRFPIKCKLSSYFRCPLLKNYYYGYVRKGDIDDWCTRE